MRLVADEPVDDVGPDLLQRLGPADVGLLVEPRPQLDEHGDLLARLAAMVSAFAIGDVGLTR